MKKIIILPLELRHQWDKPDREYSIRRQCRLAGVFRSGFFYRPVSESNENLALMRQIDEQFLRQPDYGSQRMTDWLKT